MAKPLPTTLLRRKSDHWQLTIARLEGLSASSLDPLIGKDSHANTLIVVDSVFWPLGSPGVAGLQHCFEQAFHFNHQGQSYGREVARRFFNLQLKNHLFEIGRSTHRPSSQRNDPKIPTRLCETLARANSVFRDRPFQKNIQTGTFRIWKDLGANPDAYNLWPFEQNGSKKKAWIAEGYPSLFWRELAGLKSRAPGELRPFARKQFGSRIQASSADWATIAQDPDLADSAMLALGALQLTQAQGLTPPEGVSRIVLENEGWIFGLKNKF